MKPTPEEIDKILAMSKDELVATIYRVYDLLTFYDAALSAMESSEKLTTEYANNLSKLLAMTGVPEIRITL